MEDLLNYARRLEQAGLHVVRSVLDEVVHRLVIRQFIFCVELVELRAADCRGRACAAALNPLFLPVLSAR